MAKAWSDVAASPDFQRLPPQDQEAARSQYFDSVVAPQLSAADISAARQQFDQQTGLSAPDDATDGPRPLTIRRSDKPAAPQVDVPGLQKSLSSGQARFADLTPDQQAAVARAESGVGDSLVRSVARGAPFVGAWLGNANARTNAAFGGYLGGSQAPTYDERVADNQAYERAKDRTFDADHPVASGAGQLTGGVAGTIAALPAASVSGILAGAARLGLGAGAKSVTGAVGRGIVAGGLQGASAGAGNADGNILDKIDAGVRGGAEGAVLGGAIPAVLGGIGKGVAATGLFSTDSPLSNLSSSARSYVTKYLSDPAAVARQAEDLKRLGPQAMLADVSPEWEGIAGGAATRPGSRGPIFDAFNQRDAGKNARLATDLNASIGDDASAIQSTQNILAQRQAGHDVLPSVFDKAPPVDVTDMLGLIGQRLITAEGPEKAALLKARDMLLQPSPRTGAPMAKTNAENIHNIKVAIDKLIKYGDPTLGVQPGALSQQQGALSQVRKSLSGSLRDQVPGYAGAMDASSGLAKQAEAVERGTGLFSATHENHPAIVQQYMAGLNPEQQAALRAGARAKMSLATGASANDQSALAKLAKGDEDWNRQNMRQVFGPKADDALAAVDRETQFRNTRNNVVGNSATAARQEFAKKVTDLERTPGELLHAAVPSPWAVVTKSAGMIKSVLAGALGKESADRFVDQMSGLAIAQGVTRDQFVAALQKAGAQQKVIERALTLAVNGGLIAARDQPTVNATARALTIYRGGNRADAK